MPGLDNVSRVLGAVRKLGYDDLPTEDLAAAAGTLYQTEYKDLAPEEFATGLEARANSFKSAWYSAGRADSFRQYTGRDKQAAREFDGLTRDSKALTDTERGSLYQGELAPGQPSEDFTREYTQRQMQREQTGRQPNRVDRIWDRMNRIQQIGELKEQDFEEIQETTAKIQELKPSKAFRQWQEAEGGDTLKTLVTTPAAIDIALSGVGSSIKPMIRAMVMGTMAGPAGTAAGAGSGSFEVAYSSKLFEKFAEEANARGLDINDRETIDTLSADQEFMQGATSKALRYGAGVGAFDAASGGVAGKFAAPLKGTGAGVGQIVKAGAKEAAVQGALGGGGEVVGSVAAGDPVDPKAVAEEIIGELGPGSVEIATNVAFDKAPTPAESPELGNETVEMVPAPEAPVQDSPFELAEEADVLPAFTERIELENSEGVTNHKEAVGRRMFEAFPKVTEEEAQATAEVIDAAAETWGKFNDRPGWEWYEDHLGGIRSRPDATGADILESDGSLFQPGYHGTPFSGELHGGRLSTDYIGTGEGNQAYGYGLYIADRRGVSDSYRKMAGKKLTFQGQDYYGLPLAEKNLVNPFFDAIESGELFSEAKAKAVADFQEFVEHNERLVKEVQSKLGTTETTPEWGDLGTKTYHESDVELQREILRDSRKNLARVRKFRAEDFEIKENKGALYKVDTKPAQDEYLLWDKPLSEQSDKVRAALVASGKTDASAIADQNADAGVSGGDFYEAGAATGGGPAKFSKALHAAGIRGIKYLDGMSRGKGDGSFNYVIFNDADIEITERLLQQGPAFQPAKGMSEWFEHNKGVITAFQDADVSTALHEFYHVFEPTMPDAIHGQLRDAYGVEGGMEAWTDENREHAARDFEAYMATGKAPTTALQQVFEILKEAFAKVYESVKAIPGMSGNGMSKISPIFDQMLGGEPQIEATMEAQPVPTPEGELMQEAHVRAMSFFGIVGNPSAGQVRSELKGTAGMTGKAKMAMRKISKERGNAPEFVRQLFIANEGRQSMFEQGVSIAAAGIKEAIRTSSRRLDVNTEQVARKYLEGPLSPAHADVYTQMNPKEQAALMAARQLIDTLAETGIAERVVTGQMAKTFKENIGSYLTRSYQAFDPNTTWSMETMPRRTRERMLDLLQEKDTTLTRDQAAIVAGELLDRQTGQSFYMGAASTGRINVGSLKKRKQLDPRYRAFLGEIRNPIAKVAISGRNVSQLINQTRLQREIAAAGMEFGIFSDKQSPEFSTEVFPDKRTSITEFDENGNPIAEHHRRTVDKSVAGFRSPDESRIFAPKEVAEQIQQLFEPTNMEKLGDVPIARFAMGLRGTLAGMTAVSKINLVLANPRIWMTAISGGSVAELAAGRLFVHSRMAQGFRVQATMKRRIKKGKVKINPKTVESFTKRKLSSWNGEVSDGMFEMLALNYGVLNENLILAELQTAGDAVMATPGVHKISEIINATMRDPDFQPNIGGKVFRPTAAMVRSSLASLGKFYASGDTAGKMSGLLSETWTYKKAFAESNPDMTIGEAMALAAEDVKKTTPMYDRMPVFVREASLYGLGLNQFITFLHEMFRNSGNTVRMGVADMASGNPVLQRRGARRLAAVGTLTALSAQGVSQMLLGMMDDEAPDDDQVKALLDHYFPDYLKNDNITVSRFDPDTGRMTFIENSYTLPQAVLSEFLQGVKNNEADDAVIIKTIGALKDTFAGQNLPLKFIREAQNNRDSFGEEIESDPNAPLETRLFERIAHVYDGAFKSGAQKSFEDIQKARAGWQSSYGRIFTEEEIALNTAFPIRTKTYGIHELVDEKIRRYIGEWNDASAALGKVESRYSTAFNPPTDMITNAEKITAERHQEIKEELRRFIFDSKSTLQVPESVLYEGFFNRAGVNTSALELRQHVEDLIPALKKKPKRPPLPR